jgi:hypothetical protein
VFRVYLKPWIYRVELWHNIELLCYCITKLKPRISFTKIYKTLKGFLLEANLPVLLGGFAWDCSPQGIKLKPHCPSKVYKLRIQWKHTFIKKISCIGLVIIWGYKLAPNFLSSSTSCAKKRASDNMNSSKRMLLFQHSDNGH